MGLIETCFQTNISVVINDGVSRLRLGLEHDRRKDFFQRRWALGGFSKNFPGGAKVIKSFFSHSKQKTTFFAENFKIKGGQGPYVPLPTPMVSRLVFASLVSVSTVSRLGLEGYKSRSQAYCFETSYR